jgi:FkbM family methyltransferase
MLRHIKRALRPIKNALRPIKHLIRPPPCYVAHSYSQEGEDRILARIFEHKAEGFYVDVGAHHPTFLSNTYLFYQRGWRGINLDAAPGSMAAFRNLRPADINLELAIGEQPGSLPFHIFNDPALSTFDARVAKEREGVGNWRVVEVKPIEVRPLAQVLEEYLPAGRSIDFLSVDVEGLDLPVLRSNDWERFRPEYILAEDVYCESFEDSLKNPLGVFLKSIGYVLYGRTAHTEFYKRF